MGCRGIDAPYMLHSGLGMSLRLQHAVGGCAAQVPALLEPPVGAELADRAREACSVGSQSRGPTWLLQVVPHGLWLTDSSSPGRARTGGSAAQPAIRVPAFVHAGRRRMYDGLRLDGRGHAFAAPASCQCLARHHSQLHVACKRFPGLVCVLSWCGASLTSTYAASPLIIVYADSLLVSI